MHSKMKLLITGGAGFIGSALIRYLINESDHEVLNYDALKYSASLSSLNSIKSSNRYQFVKGDICDEKLIKNNFEQFQPNGIINLAAESHVDRSIDNPTPFIQSNFFGTYNLLKTANKYFNLLDVETRNKFLFHQVSTDEVYGDIGLSDPPCSELHPYNPSSPYSASKAGSDHLVKSWFRTYNLPIIITNCSNNYGPFHFPEKFIPHIILNAIQGKKIPIYGNGQQIRDWIHVEDHVRGLMEAFYKGKPGETYNIGGSNETRNIDTALMICKILDKLIKDKPTGIKKFKELIHFVPDRPGHDKRYAINSSKIQTDIGWKPIENFETGLIKTVKWYIDNKEWWNNILKTNYSLSRLGTNK